ncbi:MAG: SDR family NAD(P)-dependent oxidoreductase [Planctomycetota bacterium]
MKQLRGKWAVVTGAGSGIGQAIARRLAHEGTHLWLIDRNADALETVAAECRKLDVFVESRVVDLTVEEEIEAVAAELLDADTPIDLLVNNAGVAYYGATAAMEDEAWNQLMAVNLHAPVLLTRRLLPRLLEQPEAHVLNVSSILGLVAHRKACAYHVSKFAMVGFSESLRAEFTRAGLGVTVLCPGFVTTRLFDRGMVGASETAFKPPPAWLCATPEKVAAKAIRGIQRNRRMVLVTPLAHALHTFKRFFPGLLDWLQTRRSRRRRHQANTGRTTLPETSVSRRSRPL